MLRLTAVMIVVGPGLLSVAAGEPLETDVASLAAALRPVVLDLMPKPLYEKSENWGDTAMSLDRIAWRRLRPQIIKVPKNDGVWQKTRVTAINPEANLELILTRVRHEGRDQLTSNAFVALPASFEHDEEIWEKGARLFRDTTEARVRVKANLAIETTVRLEKHADSILADTIFRLRVTQADVSYDNFVTAHIAGIGGTAARWIGEGLRATLKQWRPSIERELFAKLDAALIKAADTREVRISLSRLLPKP